MSICYFLPLMQSLSSFVPIQMCSRDSTTLNPTTSLPLPYCHSINNRTPMDLGLTAQPLFQRLPRRRQHRVRWIIIHEMMAVTMPI